MKHLLAITCVGLSALFNLPTATAGAVSYDVAHDFLLMPRGNQIPTVHSRTFQHAWVNDPNLRSDHRPPGQPAGFLQGGQEEVTVLGVVKQIGLAAPLTEVVTPIPARGAAAFTSTAKVNKPNNAARASSEITVNPFVAGGVVAGKLHVFGTADAPADTNAYAFSSARVTAAGIAIGASGAALGKVVFLPAVSTKTIAGRVTQTSKGEMTWKVWDPINFEMFDINSGGLLGSGTLLKIFAQGDGNLDWGSDTLSLDAMDAEFNLNIDSTFTVEQGTLQLTVAGGVVTGAKATGMFSSLALPTLGHAGAFTMSLRNDFTLNYDLDPGQNRNLDVNFDFSGGGSAFAAAPEPGTWALVALGLVAGLAARRQRSPQRRVDAAAAALAQ